MIRKPKKKSRLRRLADSTALDTFILIAIAFNCVILAFPPKMVSRGDEPGDFFCMANFALNIVFVLEFLIKFGAYGFAYFSDPWNMIDFIVVVQGAFAIVSECPVSSDLLNLPLGDASALRMIRVLRPLKSLRRFPEMRLLVASLFGSFHLLLAIIALTTMAVFVIAVFAYLYIGDALDYRCVPDPYYDPFSGTFAANPEALFNPDATQYWADADSYKLYDDAVIEGDKELKRKQNRFLATNFWKSASMYRDYERDSAPNAETYPYLASFCGECKTCRKCEKCYSDDPNDGCLDISTHFFRRYGVPQRIVDRFFGETPSTAIVNVDESGQSVPLAPQQLRGVPVAHEQSPSEPFVTPVGPDVTYIREYCVDIKNAATFEYVPPSENNTAVVDDEPQYKVLSTPDVNFFRTGWSVMSSFTRRLDLSDPRYYITRLLLHLKDCENKRKRAQRALEELAEWNPERWDGEDRVSKKRCRKKYAGKTGERRHGVLGPPRPRTLRLAWYLRFDASLWSMLSIFDIMNMENWNDALWSAQMSVGKYVWPYFYAIIAVFNICMLNLFPAVMSFNLRKAIREEEQQKALDAKIAFMGSELLSLTQFEEHMIDILAAEEEETTRVREYLKQQGSSASSSAADSAAGVVSIDADPLEGVPCVPQGKGFETLRAIVLPEDGYFSMFIYLCIFLNIVVMSQASFHVRNRRARIEQTVYDIANAVFVVIFGIEIVLKNIAMGPIGYFRDNYNKFDFVVGVLGIIDLAAAVIGGGNGRVFAVLRIIRVTRVARIFRLASVSRIRARSATSADMGFFRVMNVISLSSTWLVNILGLLFLTLYTASIVSMQIFGNEIYSLNDYSEQWVDKGRLNFDTFPMAFMTNFIVLSGDDWNTIMYNTMRKAGSVSCMFFIVLIIIGRYSILSMLTAIIFEEVERESISVIKLSVRTTMLSVFKFEHAMMNSIYRFYFFKWYNYLQYRKQLGAGGATAKGGTESAFGQVSLPPPPDPPLTAWQKFMANTSSYMIFPDPEAPKRKKETYEEVDSDGEIHIKTRDHELLGKTRRKHPRKRPLGKVRRAMQLIGRSAIFTNLIFVTIIVSIVVLALFYEIANTTGKSFLGAQEDNDRLRGIQRACVVIFVIEFVIMTIAETLFGYLSNPMNVLDSIVTVVSVVAIYVPALGAFAVLRVIRIIRPIKKLASSSPSVMSILSALESSTKGVIAVGFLAVIIWATIAVCGLQLFQGKLFYCSASLYPEGGLLKKYRPHRDLYDKGSNKYEDWPERQFEHYNERLDEVVPFPPEREPDNSQGCKLFYPLVFEQFNRNDNVVETEGTFKIKRSDYNFDNFYEAFRSSFLVFSFDDWHKLVLATMNAKTTSEYLNHEAEASTIVPAIFYFLSGCTSFLLNTLFVGVIYGTFTFRMLMSQTDTGEKRLSSLKDIQWRVYEVKLGCIKPLQEPQNPNSSYFCMRGLYGLFRHRYYKFIYTLLVLADVGAWWLYAGTKIPLAPSDVQDEAIEDSDEGNVLRAIRTADLAFCILLIVECLLKFTVFGWFTMLAIPTERSRFFLHIPIAIFVYFELTDSWNSLRNIDFARSCYTNNENKSYACDGGSLQRFLYGLRSVQVFLIVPIFVEMKTIAYALFSALGTTLPMLLLMVVSTFAFSVVGLLLLGTTELSKRDDGEPENFGSFWFQTRLKFDTINKSMSNLFIAATANDWMQVKDHYQEILRSNLKVPNVIFWLLHVIIFRYLFLNVCTLIFIYKYESTSPKQPWIAMQQVDEFLRAWQQFDEFGVGRIRTKYLSRLLRLLSPPLGMTRDAPQLLADRHAKRILMSIPLLLESEVRSGKRDVEGRWEEIEDTFVGPHVPGRPRSAELAELRQKRAEDPTTKLPRYLEFTDVIKAVHKVVIFSDLQTLPNDAEFTKEREFAQAKLDILRLAIHRYAHQNQRQSFVDMPGSSGQGERGGVRSDPAVPDMALMQRLCPDVFRYRMRQALALETHRWQRQIEQSIFDEESFHECELLLAVVREEKASAEMQLKVLNALAATGSLNAFQERRPKLHRHIAFLGVIEQKIKSERAKHVKKAWLASSVTHCGTLPVLPKVLQQQSSSKEKKKKADVERERTMRIVSSIAASASGDYVVSAHGGTTVTVWKKRKERKNAAMIRRRKAAAALKASGPDQEMKEAPLDPWKISPFYKAQVIEETSKTPVAQAVAITRDGKRFYVTCANNIKSYVRGKKVKGQRGVRFNNETVMVGHTALVNEIRIAYRYLFSVSDDGTVKMWRQRSTDAQQSATITYTERCLSVCTLNTARSGGEDDRHGLHAIVGLDGGSISVLPFSLNAQWLQGALWRSKMTFQVFDDGVPVTSCECAYGNIYAGGSTGDIAVLRAVRGDEDLATLETVAEEMKREGLQLKDLNILTRHGGAGSSALRSKSQSAASLSQVVRLERLYSLDCHTQAVTGFCLAGGLFFTSSRDFSFVSWQRPKGVRTASITSSTASKSLEDQKQNYLTARVTHRAPITDMTVAGDFLVTSDSDGNILLHKAEKYHEVVESAPAKLNNSQGDVEVIEKPAFFSLLDISKVKPRHFLAQILSHYYPIRYLAKTSKKSSKDDPLLLGIDEDSDVENLDDEFYDVVGGEDEYDEEYEEDEKYDSDEEEEDEDEDDEEEYDEYEDEYETEEDDDEYETEEDEDEYETDEDDDYDDGDEGEGGEAHE